MLSSSRLPEEPREQDDGGDAEHKQRDPEGPDGAPGPVADGGHVQARGEDRGDERDREHDLVSRGGAHPESPPRSRPERRSSRSPCRSPSTRRRRQASLSSSRRRSVSFLAFLLALLSWTRSSRRSVMPYLGGLRCSAS